MKFKSNLEALLLSDPYRLRLLKIVATLSLPDWWIGAGFVRNAVWDAIHGFANRPHLSDLDVLWFDSSRSSPKIDQELESHLVAMDSTVRWSVKNQSRMHLRNGDEAYQSSTDAMRFWPETATAIGVRWEENEGIQIAAPFGLDDLYEGVIRPTPRFQLEKKHIVENRALTKGWLQQWPKLRMVSS
ncbi:nucleotidyltransferase family protein [Herbaspirillum chlorophenolicum]|uniref:nucleotidyltransferase family protein n=1 Tax=Herbaspirillum chlorophenolicum TaxID=211589 RepID=UPI00067BF42B|nr:nucleotidyltransferase family protein [Herbaspirillum chlorophenolicum]